MSEFERRQKLAESLQDAIDSKSGRPLPGDRVEKEARGASAGRRRATLVTLVIGWGTLAAIWLVRPDAIFNPNLGLPTAPELTAEEGLRRGMYLQGARIREFATVAGRLPASIAEAGEAEPGLTYSPGGTTWSLRGTGGGREITLTSTMSPDSFLIARLGPRNADPDGA
jgi:hypothetical protein